MRYINMSNCGFKSVHMKNARLFYADLSNIIFSNDLRLGFTFIVPNVLMPITLVDKFLPKGTHYGNVGSSTLSTLF